MIIRIAQFQDGPDYCTVKDAKGKDFALTVQPDILKEMESALRVALVASSPVQRSSAESDEVRRALADLVDAVSSMRVPQNAAEAALQVSVTVGPPLDRARAVLLFTRETPAHSGNGDGTERLCRALYGRAPQARDYIGGSNAKMLHDAADRITADGEQSGGAA